jgi:hypothetical protein
MGPLEPDPVTPQAKRRASTAARLRAALHRLTQNTSHRPTIAALAREAGIGRNAIYANHREILAELQRAARPRQAAPELESTNPVEQERCLIAELKHQLRQLATQNAALLKRALDAEQRAERLDRRNAQLVREVDAVRRPAALAVVEP